jgi:hypothetical protein
MIPVSQKLWLVPTVLTVLFAAAARGGEAPSSQAPVKKDSTRFARVTEDAEGRAVALQMAVVTYTRKSRSGSLSVDLVSAIHIGDQAYYAALNKRFRDYDVVLFELIVSEDKPEVVAQQDAERGQLLTNAQLAMRSVLGLTHQLEEIDYRAANFVHADLTSAELAQSMVDRGESLYDYFWRVFFASVRQYSRDPLGLDGWRFMSNLLTPGQDNNLKTAVAYDMTNVELVSDAFGGPTGSAIIDARNMRAIEVLEDEVNKGANRIAIFYGVAHMPDLEERLTTGLALERQDTDWIDAWLLVSDPADIPK